MTTLNIGNTAIEIKTAIKTVRTNIAYLQSRIENLTVTSVQESKTIQFFTKKLETQQIVLEWLVRFQ